jgi:hypothetical protein
VLQSHIKMMDPTTIVLSSPLNSTYYPLVLAAVVLRCCYDSYLACCRHSMSIFDRPNRSVEANGTVSGGHFPISSCVVVAVSSTKYTDNRSNQCLEEEQQAPIDRYDV